MSRTDGMRVLGLSTLLSQEPLEKAREPSNSEPVGICSGNSWDHGESFGNKITRVSHARGSQSDPLENKDHFHFKTENCRGRGMSNLCF